MGWNASTLTALTPLLTDSQATSPNSFFLSSIWMSGAGLASDGSNLYFSTGNSDPSGASYANPTNIEESIVKVSSDLRVLDLFTPSNYAALDANDFEIGSGGVMVIPDSGLVVGGGKDGRMFLLNAHNFGGFTPGGPDNVLDKQEIGGCWCAPSYFMAPDGVGRVVSSGGNSVITWKLTQSSSSLPRLVQDGVGTLAASGQDPGFFTTVSSNRAGTDSGIIWAVGRPSSSSHAVTLYAFNATAQNGTLPLLSQYWAGAWGLPSNANIVPVVANGRVYVASANGNGGGMLAIFGFLPQTGALPNVIVTAASYSSATGLFTSTVKNQGATATPAGTPITVAYYVNGQYAGWGGVSGPLAAGALAAIGTSSITLTPPSGTTNTISAHVVR